MTLDTLQTHLTSIHLSRLDKLLLILAWDEEKPKQIAEIKTIAVDNGLREAKTWNISDNLKKSNGLAILTGYNWLITLRGKEYLKKKDLIKTKTSPIVNELAELKVHLNTIKDADTKAFVHEAISCLEADQKKAAIVFAWIGAISVLHHHIINHHLAKFNAEALKRNARWKAAVTTDDLATMKEYDFLQILQSISVLGKNVKEELEAALKLRNGCGHPSSLNVGLMKVAAHIETLILNVYSKF